MTDTRPTMTIAAFEAAAFDVWPGHWATGSALVHVPEVTAVEGWDLYGHPGNAQLSEPQRVLMMWSDLVGQVANGGFTQFVDNYRPNLALAYRLITRLDWPDLVTRFDRAFREQAGDPANPSDGPPSLVDEPEKWARSRERLIRHLAGRGKKWWQPVTRRDCAFVEAMHEDWQLQIKYQSAVLKGELASAGERVFDYVEPLTVEAAAFDDWFYSDETRAASFERIKAYTSANRDALCRIEG